MSDHREPKSRADRIASITLAVAVGTLVVIIVVLALALRQVADEARRQSRGAATARQAIEAIVVEIHTQSQHNACLVLEVARRAGVETQGLTTPNCHDILRIGPGQSPRRINDVVVEPDGTIRPAKPGEKPSVPAPGQPAPPTQEPGPAPQPLPPTTEPKPSPSPTCIQIGPLCL